MSYGTLISTVTVGAGGAASIDFTSIPGTYTDLVLTFSLRVSASAYVVQTVLRVNGDSSSSNYSMRRLYGDGTAAASDNTTALSYMPIGFHNASNSTSNTFSSGILNAPNYAGSTNKSFSINNVSENNGSTTNQQYQSISAGLWANTSALNQVTLIDLGGNSFVQYSTASLYGITKGSGGATVA